MVPEPGEPLGACASQADRQAALDCVPRSHAMAGGEILGRNKYGQNPDYFTGHLKGEVDVKRAKNRKKKLSFTAS